MIAGKIFLNTLNSMVVALWQQFQYYYCYYYYFINIIIISQEDCIPTHSVLTNTSPKLLSFAKHFSCYFTALISDTKELVGFFKQGQHTYIGMLIIRKFLLGALKELLSFISITKSY